MIDIDEILRPPTEAEVEHAIAMFADGVRAHYGSRLKGLYLFGSRARGDHKPDSDADIAVVLSDDETDFWKEKTVLTSIAFDSDFGTTVYIQAFPFFQKEWEEPGRHHNPGLTQRARRDAVGIGKRS